MTNFTRLGLYLNLDINNTANARVRALAKLGKNDISSFLLPIKMVGASDVKVEGEYFEFNIDADQLMVLGMETEGLVPYVQLQVMAGTVGVTPGQIDAADIQFSNY